MEDIKKKVTNQLEIRQNIVLKKDAVCVVDPDKEQLLYYMRNCGELIGAYACGVYDSVSVRL